MQKNNKRIATRLDLAVCVGLAAVLFLGFAFLVWLTEVLPLYAALLGSFAYLFLLFLWACARRGSESLATGRRLRVGFSEELEDVMVGLGQPAFFCDENGRILWCNRMLVNIVGRRDLVIGADIDDICSLGIEDLRLQRANEGDRKNELVTVGDRLYRYDGQRVTSGGESAYFVVFTDCTDYEQLCVTHREKTTVVAYIVVDNIDELLQYVQDTYRSASMAVEDTLDRWVSEMGGILRNYEKDKYVAFFDAAHLATCEERRFDVLDGVRSVRVGDGMSVTVSMGVSSLGDTLEEKASSAQAALDMALQRGGDQVVVRTEQGDHYYGGKTKAVQKRGSVRSRVIANELSTLLARTESVLIMGHRFGDFDSFGSAIGIARFCMLSGVHPHIIVNRDDANLAPCFDKISAIEDYDDVFVDGSVGMDLIRPDTLLIVVDVSNFAHTECPDVIANVRDLVIIDHHRKTTEFTREPVATYIEPSASSASELVAEILEQRMTTKSLLKEEAELMLAGILLDTKQFTRNTGVRTFGAALYLRGEGAVPGESNDLFRADIEDLKKEARFHSNVSIYNDRVAISYIDEVVDPSFRVIAAKAADKMLSLKNVSAAVTLVMIDDQIHISARSDGSINVQLVLEKLNGGGHFDVAGAQVKAMSMKEALDRLKESLDEYLAK